MLREYKSHITGLGNTIEPVSVVYNTTTKEIEDLDKYKLISQEKIRDYCECYNKSKKLTVEEYNKNIEIVMAIHKEMISKKGLESIIEKFPKRHNGLFDLRKTLSLCKSLNVICNGTKHGYIASELRVKPINSRVLEIEYKKQEFLF